MAYKKRDHSAADMPHLRGYVDAALSLEDGEEVLGEMIAKSESAAELLNFDPAHIELATRGLLGKTVLGGTHHPTSSGVARLAKTLKQDPELYDTFVSSFAVEIGQAYRKVASGDHKDHNIAVLDELVSKHPRLKQSWEAAKAGNSSADKPAPRVPEPAPELG